MNEEFFKQAIAELIHANGEALGIIVQALSQQLDPERLTKDLRSYIQATQIAGKYSPLSIRMATHALAAAEAETALNRKETH